jgi:hypothetical protein
MRRQLENPKTNDCSRSAPDDYAEDPSSHSFRPIQISAEGSRFEESPLLFVRLASPRRLLRGSLLSRRARTTSTWREAEGGRGSADINSFNLMDVS